MSGGRQSFSGVWEVVWNHSGPFRMHYRSFKRKKNDFFFNFQEIFKRFLPVFEEFKLYKSQKFDFFKTKPHMKNPFDEKLDMMLKKGGLIKISLRVQKKSRILVV